MKDLSQYFQQQLSQEKSKNQGIILSKDDDLKKINVSIDIRAQDQRQFVSSQQDNLKEKSMRQSINSYESPMEIKKIQKFEFMLQEQDQQYNKDDKEQMKLSFQQ